MNAKRIRKALRSERLLMCTYERTGTVYSLDNGVPVPRKLAAELGPMTMGCFRGLRRRGERRASDVRTDGTMPWRAASHTCKIWNLYGTSVTPLMTSAHSVLEDSCCSPKG